MPPSAILRGTQQIHNVSERLDTLADQHPLISEALITILGNVRHTATLPEVLALTEMGPVRTRVRQMPDLLISCRHGVMSHLEQILCATRGNIFNDDEEEKSDRDCKKDHFQCEKGDAAAAIDGVGP